MFFKNLVELCNQNNTTPNAVCAALKLSSAAATKWRAGAVPRDTTLKKIADYFGVTTAYLLGEGEKEKAPVALSNESEDELLKRTILYLEQNGYIQKPEYEKLKELSEEERAVIAALRRVSDEKRSMAVSMILSALDAR